MKEISCDVLISGATFSRSGRRVRSREMFRGRENLLSLFFKTSSIMTDFRVFSPIFELERDLDACSQDLTKIWHSTILHPDFFEILQSEVTRNSLGTIHAKFFIKTNVIKNI